MKKILSIFAAALVAVAVNAQTDFAAPYSCAADDAVLTGGSSSSNFWLDQTTDSHYVAWLDVSLSSNAVATWTITASRGCYVAVALDLGPMVGNNKHVFEVKILDAQGNIKGTVAEGLATDNGGDGYKDDYNMVKTLSGTILIPAAGTYTVELRNIRDWGKGSVKNVILTYDSDAPATMIAVASIELNKNELALEVAEVEQLAATVLPEDAFDPSVTWVSNDESVVTVVDGFVTAVAAGTATITATAGEQSATCAVTVAAASVPDVDFAEPYALTAKKAHLEGAVWKMYTSDTYKIYGDGGHNKNYGNAIWTINVTRPCIVSGVVNGVEGGHLFALDAYQGEELKGTIDHPESKKWDGGEIALDGTLTFAQAGEYILKLRNTQEWSSGKAAGVTLTFVEELTPAEPQVLYLQPSIWYWEGNNEKFAIYAWADGKPAIWSEYMTLAENETNIWTGTIPAGYDNLIFVRFGKGDGNPDNWYETVAPEWQNGHMWNQTENLTIQENGDDLYTITAWGENYGPCPGEWSKYVYEEPAKFYITGIDNNWEPNAIKSMEDSYVLHLDAGSYAIKITLDGTWNTVKGYTDLTEVADGLSQSEDEYNNIVFTLDEAGDVTVTYTGEVFKLEGNFHVVADGLNNIEATKVVKMIENGQMIIIKNGVRYNVLGTQF